MRLRGALLIIFSMFTLPVLAEDVPAENTANTANTAQSADQIENSKDTLKDKYEHQSIYMQNHFFVGPMYVKDAKEKSAGMFFGGIADATVSDPESHALVKSGKSKFAGGMMMAFAAIPATLFAAAAAPAAAPFVMFGVMFGGIAMSIDGQNQIMKGLWIYNKNTVFGANAPAKTAMQ